MNLIFWKQTEVFWNYLLAAWLSRSLRISFQVLDNWRMKVKANSSWSSQDWSSNINVKIITLKLIDHRHSCLPSPGASILMPLYWGSWLRHFSPRLTFPFLAFLLPPFSSFWGPYRGRSLWFRASFACELISLTVLHVVWASPVLFPGGKWNRGELKPFSFASYLHCHSKWIKPWLLLSVWLIVLIDPLETWLFSGKY